MCWFSNWRYFLNEWKASKEKKENDMKKSFGDWLAVVWHSLIGFIGGGVLPIVQDKLTSAFQSGQLQLNANSIEQTLIYAVTGAIMGAAYKWVDLNGNAALKSMVQNNITPAQIDSLAQLAAQKVIDAQAKAKTVSNPLGVKTGMFLLALLFCGVASAQTTEKTGWGINPNFVGPAQFVSTPNGFVLLQNAGLAFDLGWMDIVTTNGTPSVNKSLGMVFEENYGQSADAKTVNNAVLGLAAGYKGINLTLGFQVMGPPVGGPGSNGFVIGANYSLDSLLGNWSFF